jgi:hypothetical protein
MSVSIYLRSSLREEDVNELNLANGNFVRLMEMLDVPIDVEDGLCGEWRGEQLLHLQANVRIALDGVRAMPELDGGTETVERRGAGGCRVIECGHTPGYFEHRLSALLALVEAAIENQEPLLFS